MSIADIRTDYTQAALSELDTDPDPVVQFAKWFDEALRAEVPEPVSYTHLTLPTTPYV